MFLIEPRMSTQPALGNALECFEKNRRGIGYINKIVDLTQEKDLVEKAKGDSNAFGSLYDAYYSKVFGYVLRRTANIQVAEDIISEVFFKALKNISKFRWQGIPFSAWLYRIANNETANYFKHGKKGQVRWEDIAEFYSGSVPSAEEELLEAEAELKRHEQYLALHENILKLHIRYQEVIMLRFFENKQINEISAILGKGEGTVKSLLHRGLEKLRTFME
jgi:RNA polymerase sigma-70 factor, ECF subfamily